MGVSVHISESAKICLSDYVKEALCCLHIPPHLLGYQYLAYALEQVALEPLRVKGLTKLLYQEIARLYSTDYRAVEHAVRTAIKACWNGGGRETLDKMSYTHLVQRPWATEFIAIVAQHIGKTYCR